MYDVIIAGAGPAGSTAAKVLGEAGISTLLLDKSAFPRDKPCGGGISARAISRFPYLRGALERIATHWISKVHFESPAGHFVDYESPSPLILMVRRFEFDNLLYLLAQLNVETLSRALVRKVTFARDHAVVTADVDGESKELPCKIVIGCDSANSVVARQAGLRTGAARDEYAIDMMEETSYQDLTPRDRDCMHVFYGCRGHFGYAYIFPKSNHVNLGMGCKLDYYLSTFSGEHYAHHKSFVDGLIAKQLVSGASRRDKFRAFPIPICGPLARTSTDRVLLAGDAGGFVNAFTAEGIYYAMVSGDLAAKAAIENLRAGAPLSKYETAWRAEIGEDLEKSLTIQRLLHADIRRVDRVVRAASRAPHLADLFARYSMGAIPYREFKRAVIRRALPLYIRERFWR